MPDFGNLELVAYETQEEDLPGIARKISPDIVIVIASPHDHPTVDLLLSRLRRLPQEIVFVTVDQPGPDTWRIDGKDSGRYFHDSVAPFMMQRQQVLMIGPAEFLQSLTGSSHLAGTHVSQQSGRFRIALDRDMHPRPGDAPYGHERTR
ncbi:hypothetical protein GCM10028798_29890 [Humibacter antri]